MVTILSDREPFVQNLRNVRCVILHTAQRFGDLWPAVDGSRCAWTLAPGKLWLGGIIRRTDAERAAWSTIERRGMKAKDVRLYEPLRYKKIQGNNRVVV